MFSRHFQLQEHNRILKRITVPLSYSASPQSDPGEPSLVSDVVSLLTHHRSKSRWTYLRSILSSTTTLVPSQFSQIVLQLKSNPHLALRFFRFTLSNPSLCSHDLGSYSTIVHVLSRARLKTHARDIIRSALGSPGLFDGKNATCDKPVKFFEVLVRTYRECDSAPFVFDLLMKSCLDLEKIDGSIQIARMLRSRGISPQISTCNALISRVLRKKGSLAGYGVFREVFGEVKKVGGVRPNVHSFNALMAGFYRDGEIGMVEELWREMERFECTANGFSYSILMAVFCDGGRITEAEKLWEEIGAKGVKPDVVAYEVIIGALCEIGEMKKAEGFYREMELNGIGDSCVIYEHLIKGYCRVGDVDSAILVYKDTSRKGFRIEASTMEALIGGLCQKKRVLEALDTLRVAVRNVWFHPSGKSYEFLIKGLCEDGNMEEALKVQAEMVGKGFEPNTYIYGAFIDGYMKLGNEERAAILRKEMSALQKQKEGD